MFAGRDGRGTTEVNSTYVSALVTIPNNGMFADYAYDIEALLLARYNRDRSVMGQATVAYADVGFVYCASQIQMKFNSLDSDEIIWPAATIFELSKGDIYLRKLYLSNMATSGGPGSPVDVLFFFCG